MRHAWRNGRLRVKKSRKSVVAYERLTKPRFTMARLLAKARSFSNLPAFLDLNGRKTKNDSFIEITAGATDFRFSQKF